MDLVIATRENTSKLGYFVDDTVVNPGLGIPYYKTVPGTIRSEVLRPSFSRFQEFFIAFYRFPSCFRDTLSKSDHFSTG